jgi:PAS domain S-box-containing protein
MAIQRIRVLLVEDNPGDVGLIRELLAEVRGSGIELECLETLAGAIARLRTEGIDLVLLDLDLPDSSRLDTLRGLLAASPKALVIVLSGLQDEEIAVQAVQQGAQDYLIKGQVDRSSLVRSIRYALERGQAQDTLRRAHAELEAHVRNRTAELVQANEALRNSQHLLESIMDNSDAVIFVKDAEGRYLLVNRGFETALRRRRESILGKTNYDLIPREDADRCRASDERVMASDCVVKSEESFSVDGSDHTYIVIKTPLRNGDNRPYAVCGIATDITEWKRLQEQVRQAQKMEAIGRLAGGVAHDFNNLLGIIMGYSEFLRSSFRGTPAQMEQLDQVIRAAKQGGELTRKLLTFSRRDMPQLKVMDLNIVLRDLEKMLRRVVSENIELALQTGSTPGLIRSDPGQIEQSILNLVINACDAMPDGGKLTIASSAVRLTKSLAGLNMRLPPGPYILLTVTDTGCGMDGETQARIFEPFFTTKAQGKGTGLGLATVYGTVEQAGGAIVVETEPGKGASFQIYLPRAEGTAAAEPVPALPVPMAGSETILLVEDQEEFRGVLSEVLKLNGYTVLEANNGRQALLIARRQRRRIDLVVTDLVMPYMGGRDLVRALAASHPETKALYMSGYADEAVTGSALPDFAFMDKPFTPVALVRKVREILDEPKKWSRSRTA